MFRTIPLSETCRVLFQKYFVYYVICRQWPLLRVLPTVVRLRAFKTCQRWGVLGQTLAAAPQAKEFIDI